MNTLKKDWDPAKWSLQNILGVIRCLLIIPFPESSLNEEAGRLFMDNYQEYFRMAKLMTTIHAQPEKEEEEVDENENIASPTQESTKEESKDKVVSGIKFQYKQASNLDVSMEEEDKTKEPLQNYSNMMNSNINKFTNVKSKVVDPVEEGNIFGSKPAGISGASLFGAAPVGGMKKPKNKKKKPRRI